MVIGAKWANLSILETIDPLVFSYTIISMVFRKWSEKEKTSSKQQLSQQFSVHPITTKICNTLNLEADEI